MNTTPQPVQGPTLVILAAGMGSRFGGMKQLASVGPAGETLMDYSIHDALRAGFESAVFIIRPEMEETFREFAGQRYGRRLTFRTVHQRLEDVPDGFTVPERPKPWGTGQAVLAAEPAVSGPFAVRFAREPAYSRRKPGYGCRVKSPSGLESSPAAINPDSMMCATISATVRLPSAGWKVNCSAGMLSHSAITPSRV